MDKKTFEQFLDDIDQILDAGQININYGEYEGSNMVIFDQWKDIEYVVAYLNGFEHLTEGVPYIRDNENIADLITAKRIEVEANPDHYGYKRELKQLTEYLLYKQYLATLEHDPISLDDYDLEVGFSDEYDYCCHCYSIIRTSADSYSWTAPLYIDAEGYACDECVSKGEFDEYILDEYCNVEKSIPDSADLDRLELVKINDDSYQNGFHSGMDDSPKPIIEKLNNRGIDVWFKVSPSQFYVEFDVYVKSDNVDKAKQILSGVDTYQGYSTAGNLEKCLKQCNVGSSAEGIVYTKCDVSNGTVETRVVSDKEFIEGIKK